MSSATPSRCAPGRFSIPSFRAALATLNASIESDFPRSRSSARACHVLRRDAHDPLPARNEETLERAGDVPAVLDRPDPLGVERSRPYEQLAKATPARRRRIRWDPNSSLQSRIFMPRASRARLW